MKKYFNLLLVLFITIGIITSANTQTSSLVTSKESIYYNSEINFRIQKTLKSLEPYSDDFILKELLLGHNNYWIAGSVIELKNMKSESEMIAIADLLKKSIPDLVPTAGISIIFKYDREIVAIGSANRDSKFVVYTTKYFVNKYFELYDSTHKNKNYKLHKVYLPTRNPNWWGFWKVYKDSENKLRARSKILGEKELPYLRKKDYGFQLEYYLNERESIITTEYILFGDDCLGKIEGYYVTPDSGKFGNLYVDFTEYLKKDSRFNKE